MEWVYNTDYFNAVSSFYILLLNSPLKLQIKQAFRLNLVPAIFLQIIALIIGLSYFYLPVAQGMFSEIAAIKNEYGLAFSIISTAIFGGLLPFSYLYFSGKIEQQAVKQIIFYCVMWAGLGALVDYFYFWQAIWFGHEASVMVIVKKTLVDQFIFSALFTCPLITILYLWKDCHFQFKKLQQQLNKDFFTLKIPSLVITNWMVWIPSVLLIYTMPSALQVPLFNIVLCFFVLVLSVLTAPDKVVDK